MMKKILLSLLATVTFVTTHAETKPVNVELLSSKRIYDSADVRILALSPDKKPAVVMLDMKKGAVVPPHKAPNVTRIITVISGTAYMGDGESIEAKQEKVYRAGDVFVMPPNQMHWSVARDDDVRLQLVFLYDESISPEIDKQLK